MKNVTARVAFGTLLGLASVFSAGAQGAAPELTSQFVGIPSTQNITALDKASFITADMAKFYLAVGVMKAWECARTQDPTLCHAYLESLKDPVGHIGFLLFIAANHSTGAGVRKLTGHHPVGQVAGSWLGLAAGMLVQDFFSEIYHHPLTKQYLAALKRPPSSENTVAQNQLLNELWKLTLGDSKWWLNKVPDLTGLIGAATLSGLKVPVAMKTLDLSEKTLRFVSGAKGEIRAIGRARTGLRYYQAASMGFKLVWNGSKLVRIHPLVAIGTQVVETVIFLNFAEWISEPAAHAWHRNGAVQALNQTRLDFYYGRSGKTVDDNAQALSKAWDDYRLVYSMDAQTVQARYLTDLQDLESQVTRLMTVAMWVGSGMDPESPLAQGGSEDEMQAKANAWEALYTFFCGDSVEHAVEPAQSFYGLPVPFRDRNVVHPFRIVKVRDEVACASGAPMHLLLDKARSGDFADELDRTFARLETLVDPLRKQIIARYETRIQESIVRSLTGRAGVALSDGSMMYTLPETAATVTPPDGILPAFDVEASHWASYARLNPALAGASQKALEEVAAKRKSAQELLDYVSAPRARRKIPQAVLDAEDMELLALFKDDKTEADWEKVVRFWRGFILTP